MRDVFDHVLIDVGRMFNLSIAGDLAFFRGLSDRQLLEVCDCLCRDLLLSVERRNRVFTRVETLSERQNGSVKNVLASVYGLIFGPDGREVAFPSVAAFDSLYQAWSLLSKYGSGEITAEMERNAVESYLQIEDAMDDTVTLDTSVLQLCRAEIARVLDPTLPEFLGRHGPGSVAEGALPSGKKYAWTPVDSVVPSDFFALREYYAHEEAPCYETSVGHLADGRCSRWLCVPKTWHKVRAICAEPSLLQFLQQSLGRRIAFACRVAPFCGADTSRQDTNSRLALEASGHGYFCTLDLSAASDRLSLPLVKALLPEEWFRGLASVRSLRTRIPDGREILLRKFGSMGNATTFPVQSLVYWALLVALMRSEGVSASESRSLVYAYGDDIIMPSTYARSAMSLLSDVGLKVNVGKSFVNGSFRESCGMHAYYGISVTPAYLRTSRSSGPGLVSMCSCANGLFIKGYASAAEVLYTRIENILGHRLPTVGERYEAFVGRQVQLARVNPWLDARGLIDENRSRGVKVRVSRTQQLTVRAFGLYELKTKRRANVLATTADLWSLTRGRGGLSDRGLIAGNVALSQRDITLL